MLDRRLFAYRSDLAEAGLEGKVQTARFVTGEGARVAEPVAALRPRPETACGIDTELLLGETVSVFERRDGWAWVKAEADGYVGYLPEAALAAPLVPTHHVIAPRSFIYPGPDLRLSGQRAVSMGSRLTVTGETETRGTRYLTLADGGAVVAAHCLPLGQFSSGDPLDIAARFLETPYLWGGRSGFGIDCSGLVQMAMAMTGRTCPRESDMQEVFFTREIGRADLRRGDLVFWKGHVGWMEDARTLLHANGHTMTVARENFDRAVERIGWLYQQPTAYRRPDF